ncbi:hypothetical protein GCM10022226_26270 [Sphaerisporangium flaviroseum]|uniref:SMI1/KNR4 family protein n=1 Tax=Sphaerisporangium flaviroseum TaxID=509199 RepID=A0ABP7HWX0_9ACTN
MQDELHTFPAEGQWDLLVEYGLHEWFSGQWVDIEDIGEIARRLRVDLESGTVCDFQTAMRSYSISSKTRLVWIGEHAPGWSHVLTLSGATPPSEAIEALSAGERRVFDAFFIEETGHLQELLYSYDGACVGNVCPPHPGGTVEVAEYDAYASGLELSSGMRSAEIFDRFLCMAGRITGRFIDRDWFSSTRTLYQIPEGAWNY